MRGWPACWIDEIDQLPRGAGVRVVGEMPHLAGGVGMFAEDGEAFADVGDVGVGVGLVGVAEDGGGLSGQGGREQSVAEVGLGAASGSEVVRGASDGDRHPAGLVGVEQLGGHPAAESALLGVGGVVAGLGQWPSRWAAVHVDVLHADQPGAMGFGSGEHAGLEGRELRHPTLIWRVHGLIHHLGAAGDVDGELRIGGVAAHDLNPVRYSGGAGAVDHPYRLASAEQRIKGGQPDGTGAEDHVTGSADHALSFSVAPTGSCVDCGLGARPGSSTLGSTPDSAEKGDGAGGAGDGELLLKQPPPMTPPVTRLADWSTRPAISPAATPAIGNDTKPAVQISHETGACRLDGAGSMMVIARRCWTVPARSQRCRCAVGGGAAIRTPPARCSTARSR